MLDIGVAVDLREFRRVLDSIGTRARDLSAWFRGYLLPEYHKMMAEQFATRGAHLGGRPWRQLALSTIARKGHDHQLWESGELARAFSDPTHPDAVVIISALAFSRTVRGRARKLGLIHSLGTPRIPKRVILPGIPNAIVTVWSGSLRRYLLTGAIG
jgi:hypothetical protein